MPIEPFDTTTRRWPWSPNQGRVIWLGAALAALQRISEAEASYRAAVAVDSTHVDAWYNLGNLYRRLGDEPGALEAYGRVVTIDADPALTKMAKAKLSQIAP